MKTNQETAAKQMGEQNEEWLLLARATRDVKQPDQAILFRVSEGRQGESKSRIEKD